MTPPEDTAEKAAAAKAAAARAAGTARQIRAQEMHLGMLTTRNLGLPVVAFMTIMVTLLLMYVPVALCVAWCTAFAGFVASRELLNRMYFAASPAMREARAAFWLHMTDGFALWYGAQWGTAAALGIVHSPPEMRLFWTGMVASNCGMLSSLLPHRQVKAQLLSALGPTALAWWLVDRATATYVVPAMALLALVCVLIAHQQRSGNRERIVLSLRNEALAATLEQRNQALDATNRAKTALLATASHDLRQPVHALGMIVELMDPDDPPALRRRLASVRSCTQTLSDMLTQLLDFNRLDLGLYKPVVQPVAMDALLAEVRESFAPDAAQKGLRLNVNSPALCVASDARLLRRLLSSLVANAVRYTHAGSVDVTCAERRGVVSVAVADTGMGIAPERLGDIFAEYVRLPSHLSDAQEGLGLGLSIVRKGAALLGHAVSVSSSPDRGSCFTLTLGAPVACEAPPAHVTPFQAMPQVTVAVVENDPFVLGGLVDTLTEWGCTAVGGQSLAQIEAALMRTGAKPALLVSDLHLANAATGFDVIGHLRAVFANAQLPAILLTGDLDPVLEERARVEGVWLAHKPIHPSRMRTLVLQALAHVPAPAASGGGGTTALAQPLGGTWLD